MSSRGTYGSRSAKSAEKQGEKSRIPIIGISRKSSVTSTASATSKAPSSSTSWFSRGRRNRDAIPPFAPPTSIPSTTTKVPSRLGDIKSSQKETLGQTRYAQPSHSDAHVGMAKPSSSTYVPDSEIRRRNVLRRKPSSIDQRSRYAHTESSVAPSQRAVPNPQDTVSSPDTSGDQYAGSVFGVALPAISASSSYLPARSTEPSDQATSSSRMAAYNAYRAPKTPTPQLLPPLAPSFANSSGSSTTRRSESPGAFSRTSTPTSISSYSPGIPVMTKSPLRPRQTSPTRSRPPVTRNWHGNNSKQELEAIESRSLSAVQEAATSSSSSDTVRGNERPVPIQQNIENASASKQQGPTQQAYSPLMGSAPEQTMKDSAVRSFEAPLGKPTYSHEPAHDSFTHVARSASQIPSKTPPPRPSREGTPRLEDVVFPSPVIRSNLSRLETTGHKRRDSWGKSTPLSANEAQWPSTGRSTRGPSPTRSTLRLAKSTRLPSPNIAVPVPSQTWPAQTTRSKTTTTPSLRDRAAARGRDPSPASARATKPSSRFGLFSRRASPVRSSTIESAEKASKKGPAAGTGHEGYGKYARRGRSGSTSTSSSRGRSTSTTRSASSVGRPSNGRRTSFTGKEEPVMDDFLRDRLSPVIISGGRVSSDRNSGAELYRTTSGASSASIASSDDPSSRKPQFPTHRPTSNVGGSTMVINNTASSHRATRSLPRDQDDLRSAKTSDAEEDIEARGHTLAARRSMHRSQLLKRGEPTSVPAPINTRGVTPSPAMGSRDTLQSSALRTDGSLQLTDDISEGREGNWLKSKKADKPAKPSKWNFLQRANAAHKKPLSRRPSQDQERPEELPAAITRLPTARPVAHYAMIDNNGQDIDDTDLVPSLKDIDLQAVAGQSPSLSHQHEAWKRQEHKRSMLLPSPPTVTGEFSHTQSLPSPKVLLRQPAPISESIADAPKPRVSRLQQVGRIPRVVSKRDRPHKPPPQSFSRPFARGNATEQEQAPRATGRQRAHNVGRPALGVQTQVIPQDPWGETDSAKPASAPAGPQSQPHSGIGDQFLVFPQRYNSGLSGSSSSGTMSFVVATADKGKKANPSHEDEVWNEYDDFLDTVESPVPQSVDRFNTTSKRNSPPKDRMTPAPLRIRKDSSASSTHSTSAQDLPPMTSAPTLPLPSPPSMIDLLSPNMASSPMSFSDFIAGYGDRNRGSAVSKVRSSVSGSRYSQASVQSTLSEAEQKRHNQIMAEKTRNSSGSQSNLRFSALMTSRWLSFGRVLFSPAHNEIQTTKQDRVLVLDGLGNDDWSFYCALTYPDATVYNLSSFKRMGTASARRRELGTVQSPSNHRQIFHAGMAAPFPFPKGYFSAAVFRFPAATTEAAYYNAVSECKRVLRPGGFLETSILDIDMVNMGNRARRAVRALKVKMQVAQPNVCLKPLSDDIQKMLGRRGFENLSRCMVTVPVAGLISDSRAGSLDERDVSFGEMLQDPSPQGDESITKMVSKVGRWWYTRCYESGVLPDAEDSEQSIWADRALLKECEKRETGLKLLICYAQKPLRPKRRTISL
ncbi:MAG: hypothetical protein L6R39_002195 [Caloplaca ligustica]|nr:MAG: hypothetical protein L6R39_002195 [Caloplaca ligustica]